ncbi:MAG: hypothetical protein ACR2KZ_00615 [Segetibacter sp.]
MKPITYKDELVAIFHKADEWKEGLDFLTPDTTYIQAGTWNYNKDKVLKAHRHKQNSRVINQTQETFVLMSGRLRVELYDENNHIFYQEELSAGDLGIIFNVGHGYFILEDNTKVVEVKPGPFTSVDQDKEMI